MLPMQNRYTAQHHANKGQAALCEHQDVDDGTKLHPVLIITLSASRKKFQERLLTNRRGNLHRVVEGWGIFARQKESRFSFSAAGEPFSGLCDVGQFGPHCWVDAVILGSINQALCRQSICLTISGGTEFNYCTKSFVFFFNIEINIAILI